MKIEREYGAGDPLFVGKEIGLGIRIVRAASESGEVDLPLSWKILEGFESTVTFDVTEDRAERDGRAMGILKGIGAGPYKVAVYCMKDDGEGNFVTDTAIPPAVFDDCVMELEGRPTIISEPLVEMVAAPAVEAKAETVEVAPVTVPTVSAPESSINSMDEEALDRALGIPAEIPVPAPSVQAAGDPLWDQPKPKPETAVQKKAVFTARNPQRKSMPVIHFSPLLPQDAQVEADWFRQTMPPGPALDAKLAEIAKDTVTLPDPEEVLGAFMNRDNEVPSLDEMTTESRKTDAPRVDPVMAEMAAISPPPLGADPFVTEANVPDDDFEFDLTPRVAPKPIWRSARMVVGGVTLALLAIVAVTATVVPYGKRSRVAASESATATAPTARTATPTAIAIATDETDQDEPCIPTGRQQIRDVDGNVIETIYTCR